jgi:hypothetical protein
MDEQKPEDEKSGTVKRKRLTIELKVESGLHAGLLLSDHCSSKNCASHCKTCSSKCGHNCKGQGGCMGI